MRHNIGERIRKLRESLGESQAEFGERFRVEQGTVSRWETGASLVKRAFQEDMAKLAGTTVAAFFYQATERQIIEDDDLEEYVDHDGRLSSFKKDIDNFATTRNSSAPYLVQTRVLDLAGYLPGDIVIFDLDIEPRAGDAVRAIAVDRQLGRKKNILRIFDPPYLLTSSTAPKRASILNLESDEVEISGVVAFSLRIFPRRK
jgi:transcriptional regulator with XRE-family HTH domain